MSNKFEGLKMSELDETDHAQIAARKEERKKTLRSLKQVLARNAPNAFEKAFGEKPADVLQEKLFPETN